MIRIPTILILSVLAAPAPTVTFPDTPAGRVAAAWFPAFNAGEAAMRGFFEKYVSKEGLERRPIEHRLEIYRGMREERRSFTPISVSDGDGVLRVTARDASSATSEIEFVLDPGATGTLAGVRVQDVADVGGPPEATEEPGAAPAPMSDEGLVSALRARLDSLSRADVFSGAVLLARGDRALFREAYGHASRERRTANRPDTKFNLGSINKIFTKVAIDQLAAAGKLRLSDTIDHHLPDYPADKGGKITIQHLIDHRGGTGDIFNQRFESMDVSKLRTTADWMDVIRDQPLEFEPGTSQAYSNAGYVLLGAIVEKVSGLSYYDYVRRHIFEPAGMRATDSYAKAEKIENRATGYSRQLAGAEGGWRENTGRLPGRGSAAGGGYSTLDDLWSFSRAMKDRKLGVAQQGLGIAGGAPGINAALETAGDYTLVVLANLDPPAAENVASAVRGWLRRAGAPMGTERRMIRRPGGPGTSSDAGATPGRRVILGGEPGAAAEAGAGPGRRIVRGGPEDPIRKPAVTQIPKGGVEVPMTRSGHLPAVEVMVNGKGPFRFAIDTGGAGTMRVDSSLAAKLGLETIGEVMAGDPSGRNVRARPLVSLDSIAIGGARFERLLASVRGSNEPMRGEGVDGVLGFGLFADCLFTLDYPGNRLRIERGELPPPDGAEVFEFRDSRGIPEVAFTIDGREMWADLDAGAPHGFSLPEAKASELTLASKPRVVGQARTASNTFEVKAADLKGEIALGRHRFSNPTITFQPVFPMANIGSQVLKDFRVTFDQKNHRIRFEQTGTAEAGR